MKWEYSLSLRKEFIMKLNEKVKYYREIKRLSQESVAFELGLNQSQYSRRENGSIKFDADEISHLSKILDVSATELFGDEAVIFNNTNQSGGNFGQYIQFPEKTIRQYEKRLLEKDDLIQFLKDRVHFLESQIEKKD